MSEKKEGIWQRRFKRWLMGIFFLLLFLTACGGVFHKAVSEWPSNPFRALLEGMVVLLGLHCVGMLTVVPIIRNADAALFYYTPMTPKLFFRHGVRRRGLIIVSTCVIAPVLILFALPVRADILLDLNLLLLYYLSFLLPLQALVRRGPSPALMFFPFRQVLRISRSTVLILLLWIWTPRLFASTNSATIAWFNAWFSSANDSAVTHALLLFLSPLSELFLAQQSRFAAPLSWVAFLWFSCVAFFCVRDVIRARWKGFE